VQRQWPPLASFFFCLVIPLYVLQVYQLLDQAWGSYSFFCSSYEDSGKELGTLVAAALQPYVPGLLAGASDIDKAKAVSRKVYDAKNAEIADLTLQMQRMQDAAETAKEEQIALFKEIIQAINTTWSIQQCISSHKSYQSYAINQMSKPAMALLQQTLEM
jgi:hypothetical protein